MSRWKQTLCSVALFVLAASCAEDEPVASGSSTEPASESTAVSAVPTTESTLELRDPLEGEVVPPGEADLADVMNWISEEGPRLSVEFGSLDGTEALVVTGTATACQVADSIASTLRWNGLPSLGQHGDQRGWVRWFNGLEVVVSDDQPGAFVVANDLTLATGSGDECRSDSLGRHLGPDDPYESIVEGARLLEEIPSPAGSIVETSVVPTFLDDDGDGFDDRISARVTAVVSLPEETLKCGVATLVEPYVSGLGWMQSSLETASSNSAGTFRLSRFVDRDRGVEITWSMDAEASQYFLTYSGLDDGLPFAAFVADCSDDFAVPAGPDVVADEVASLARNRTLFAELSLPPSWLESGFVASYGIAYGTSEPIGFSSAWSFTYAELDDVCAELDSLLTMLERLGYQGTAYLGNGAWRVLVWRNDEMVKIDGAEGSVTVEVMGNGAVVGTNQRPPDLGDTPRLGC